MILAVHSPLPTLSLPSFLGFFSSEHLEDLVLRDDFRQGTDVVDLGLIKDFPSSWAGSSKEELDSREDDALGSRPEFEACEI